MLEAFLRHLSLERGLSPHTISAYRRRCVLAGGLPRTWRGWAGGRHLPAAPALVGAPADPWLRADHGGPAGRRRAHLLLLGVPPGRGGLGSGRAAVPPCGGGTPAGGPQGRRGRTPRALARPRRARRPARPGRARAAVRVRPSRVRAVRARRGGPRDPLAARARDGQGEQSPGRSPGRLRRRGRGRLPRSGPARLPASSGSPGRRFPRGSGRGRSGRCSSTVAAGG